MSMAESTGTRTAQLGASCKWVLQARRLANARTGRALSVEFGQEKEVLNARREGRLKTFRRRLYADLSADALVKMERSRWSLAGDG